MMTSLFESLAADSIQDAVANWRNTEEALPDESATSGGGRVIPILMPQAGNTMEEGTVISWSVKEGDQIEIRIAGDREFEVSHDQSKQRALERLRQLRRPLPPGFTFSREQANER